MIRASPMNDKSTSMKASVIIPTLNEADAIRDVVSAVCRVVPESEVLVVDCSSKDGTPEIAKEAGAIVIDDPRPGYGRAILTGLERARGEVIAVIDGDGSYEADDIPKTILPILNGEADLVLASRLGGKIFPEAMPKVNHIGNYLLTWIYNTLYNQSVTDTQTGLRSIRREAFEKLDLDDTAITFLTNMLITVAKMDLRIMEIPTTYYARRGHSKLHPLRDGWKIFWCLIKRWFE
jgi:glycosyltransferase involved in cell wall biosynthesis